jgi:microcin C transport system substrate-binding protein
MSKKKIEECIRDNLNTYFEDIAGLEPNDLYNMVLSAVEKPLLDVVMAAKTREELDVATKALDRVLRSIRFWVPEWYKAAYSVAFYDIFGRPEKPPTYVLGETSLWWYDADKAAKLKASGALR